MLSDVLSSRARSICAYLTNTLGELLKNPAAKITVSRSTSQRSIVGIVLVFVSLPLWAQSGPDWILRGSNTAWTGGHFIATGVCGGSINETVGDDALGWLTCAQSAWIAHCTDPGTMAIGIGLLADQVVVAADHAPAFTADDFTWCPPVGANGGWYLATVNPLCDDTSELDPVTFVCIADPGDIPQFYLEPPDQCMASSNNDSLVDETNPCNPANGNKSQAEVDYVSPADGGLSFARYYNSKGGYKTGQNMAAGWRHSYSRVLNETPDRAPMLTFAAPADQSAAYGTASDACTLGWDDIKNTVWAGDLAAATAVFAGGNVCTIESGGSSVAYFPVRSPSGWSGFSAPANINTITRSNGSTMKFEFDGSAWINELNPSVSLVASGTDWIYTDTNDTQETYNSSGQLTTITYRSGTTETLEYNLTAAQGGDDDSSTLDRVTGPFGHSITLTYDATGLLDTATSPDGVIQYGYDGNNNLTSVTYPDATIRQYHYEDASLPNHLTGITDENTDRFATWAYDTAGRAILSEHAGGKEQVQLAYNADDTTTLTLGNGAVRTYTYSTVQGMRKLSMLTGDPCGNCAAGNIADRTYDANGFTDEIIDWNSNTTQTVRNNVGLTETLVEAKGSTEQRTTTTIWHSTFRLPEKITSPKNVTDMTYDVSGNLETVTVTGGLLTRAWAFTYNSSGQPLTIDGPRTDVTDVTTLAYYTCTTGAECGQLLSVTNALSQITTYDSYDAAGRLTQMTDPNGLITGFAYDSRGNLLTVTQTPVTGTPRVTTMSYDAASQLEIMTTPDGLTLTYTYDAAHYLRSVTDNFGNRIDYDYDAMGNLKDEDTYDPGNVLKRALDYAYDLNNRLDTVTNGGFITDLAIDLVGNLTNEVDPKLASTQHAYDALNRLDQTIDALTGVIDYDYDAHDNITTVTAPNGATTSYQYDELDNLTQEVSPDRGTIIYTYDDAGNRVTELDARGMLTTYTYDALNRLTLVTLNAGSTIGYEYDIGANAIGRLNQITDASGFTTWTYDNFGAVTQKTQTIGTVALSTSYIFDSSGRLSSITLPSGKVITYGYNIFLPNSVSVDGQTILSGATYDPFGPVNAWTWGNGSFASRNFDLRGLMDSQTLAGDARALGYDAAGQVTSMLDSNLDVTFDYDLLGRLTDLINNNGGGSGSPAGPMFGSTPVILADIQTAANETGNPPVTNPTPWLMTGVRNVSDSSVQLSLERAEVNAGSITVPETIGYIAIAGSASGTFSANSTTISYEAQTSADNIKGWQNGCYTTNFLSGFASSPTVVATINRHDGGEGGWIRRCSLSSSAIGLTIDEDQYRDSERRHNSTEAAGVAAFSQDFDAQFTDEIGTWGMEAATVVLAATTADPTFKQVNFRQVYTTPPIVVVLATNETSEPAAIRIRNVTTTGFEAVQVEPANLDGVQGAMTLHYLAVEPGTHELPDGTRVLADTVSTTSQQHGTGVSGTESWENVTFADWPGTGSGMSSPLPASQLIAYDANGNRETFTEDGTPYSYTNLINSNRLLSTAGPVAKTYTYDAAGNVTSDGLHAYLYDDRGRLVDVDAGAVTYEHNGQGQRVKKTTVSSGGGRGKKKKATTTEVLFVYDKGGNLIGEYDTDGNATSEHVWFGAAPVAVLQGPDQYYVHTDQLGTPRVITDGNTIIWRWQSDPFGSTVAQEDPDGDGTEFTYNPRFPGQYFDQETGLHYNYFRTYDPKTGRYITSDPIGLGGGLNTYTYANGNPINFIDPLGLACCSRQTVTDMGCVIAANQKFRDCIKNITDECISLCSEGGMVPTLVCLVMCSIPFSYDTFRDSCNKQLQRDLLNCTSEECI